MGNFARAVAWVAGALAFLSSAGAALYVIGAFAPHLFEGLIPFSLLTIAVILAGVRAAILRIFA